MTSPKDAPRPDQTIRLIGRDRNQDIAFDIRPDAAQIAALVGQMGVNGIAKLRFSGRLRPFQDKGWQLAATLGATVTQACVITLQPVKARIDVPVTRRFVPMAVDEATELDLDPEADDDLDPLSENIDLGAILAEELALALPPYPRAPDADLASFAAAEGITLDTGKENPFAALAALRGKMPDDPQ